MDPLSIITPEEEKEEDNSSDYGPDFTSEEARVLEQLLAGADGLAVEPKTAIKDTDDDDDDDDGENPKRARRLPRLRDCASSALESPPAQTTSPAPAGRPSDAGLSAQGAGFGGEMATAVESSESRVSRYRSPAAAASVAAASVEKQAASSREGTPDADTRSPLQRFRTKPKKAFSVTDLVSPAWCELQYLHTLAAFGRKRRTPAMRQGSAVHRALEEQELQQQQLRTVRVRAASREDAFALRLWNVVHGLAALRRTGITRELEVWGVLEGQVVNGVVDELSYLCPDQDLEVQAAAAAAADAGGTAAVKGARPPPLPGQPELTDFLSPKRRKTSKVYICDVKTRAQKVAPTGGSFRPTLFQLMLYRLLISELVAGRVPLDVVMQRYDLDPDAPFSDAFIAQIASLDQDYHDAPAQPAQSSALPPPSGRDAMELLLENNSLRRLWRLMVEEFQRTMAEGADSLGRVLKVEYRDRADGSVTGTKTFLYDERVITDYVRREMRWWRGEREAEGVCIEEAYKCRTCDFQHSCHWRLSKIVAATHAHRARSGRSSQS